MEKIEYVAERKEVLDLPNCFCGTEPKLIEDFEDIGRYRCHYVFIRCPYCHAQTNRRWQYDSFNPYWQAVEEAAEDWIKLIERR